MALARRLVDRIDAAIRRRAPSGTPPLTVPSKRVYILPSAAGGLFGVVLVAMLAGATNYGNNLTFSLTFWLAAVAFVSMHRAHRNLVGLDIAGITAEPVFTGQTASFSVELASRARLARRGLYVSGRITGAGKPVSVERDASACARIEARAIGRGRLACPRLTISSRYPMGLFRCWSYAAPTAHVVVYPAPIDQLSRSATANSSGDSQALNEQIGNTDFNTDFAGHRLFQTGDSPRRIDWKASARTDELLITEHSATRAQTHWFDYSALDELAPEARLSQLAFWVTEAERRGNLYGLRLPVRSIGPASGRAHERACLEALALF